MRQVLVMGAAGFLGSHLVPRLLEDGHQVIGMDNLLTGRADNLAGVKDHPRFTFIEQDAVQKPPLPDGLDDIYHLASPASPPDYQRYPFESLHAGAAVTSALLRLARDHEARFFLASTSEVYGDPTVSPQSETYWGNVNPIGPRSVYDEAKRFAEAATMSAWRAWDLDVRIARIFNTYGPRMRPNDGRVVSNFIQQALEDKPLTVYGEGRQTRSFCYVSDLIEGFVRLMDHGDHHPTNLGNPTEHTVIDLAHMVRRLSGKDLPIRHSPIPEDDPKTRRPDVTRAKQILHWSPQVDLEAGLQHTMKAFQQARKKALAEVPR